MGILQACVFSSLQEQVHVVPQDPPSCNVHEDPMQSVEDLPPHQDQFLHRRVCQPPREAMLL